MCLNITWTASDRIDIVETVGASALSAYTSTAQRFYDTLSSENEGHDPKVVSTQSAIAKS